MYIKTYIYNIVMSIDIDKLYRKAQKIHQENDSVDKRITMIKRLKEKHLERLAQSKNEIKDKDINLEIRKPIKREQIESNKKEKSNEKGKLKIKSKSKEKEIKTMKFQEKEKNIGVGDVDKMMFDKKFKNYLNHQQEFKQKSKLRRQKIMQERKAIAEKLQPGEDYFNEQQIMSNTDSDYQFADANDMKAAYEQIATGIKKKKGGVQLFHAEKFQFSFRFRQYETLLEVMDGQSSLISKDLFLDYLFEVPCVMMLYSINPYTLADELADFQTQVPQMLSFQQFSSFLLINRSPTYFQYTESILAEAKSLGRGLKCSAIVGKWIGDSQIYELLLECFEKIDLFGNGVVDRVTLAKKIYKEAEYYRFLDSEVIQIVNIGKCLPLSRIIYQIEHQIRDNQEWSLNEFIGYLDKYYRLKTPEKDKLITKMIMSGKFDSSYIYVVSGEVLEFLKKMFIKSNKFAEYYVLTDRFIDGLRKSPQFTRISNLLVRSQGNRYVKKQSVNQSLIRLLKEADEYIDLQEILDFFTNRGRPRKVEYDVYIANLERQIEVIEEEQRKKYSKGSLSTSSDDQFGETIKMRKKIRKQQKLKEIQASNNFKHDKKFNVTIPVGFGFENRKHKTSIREVKVKEMIAQKRAKEDQCMIPIKANEVPKHVKQNLFERITKDQERQRQQRLQRFRLQIANSMCPVSDHLTRPLDHNPHCDFTREQYKFVARPMPWYCQVNLLQRINKKKQQRREQILQEIINRNQDNDLPEGVQKMIERHDQIEEKRKNKSTQRQTASGDIYCTFMPKITHKVPDFKTIHQHLRVDLDIARDQKVPVVVQPFSFENRPARSKTTHQPKLIIKKIKQKDREKHIDREKQKDNEVKVAVTAKYQALVDLRRKQEIQSRKKDQEIQKADEIRKMRQQKFAPYVREVLRKKDYDLGVSRSQLKERIADFKKTQRQRKKLYEQEMIKIYTKVFNRPLLVQTMGEMGENQVKKATKYEQEDHRKYQKHQKQPRAQKNQGNQKNESQKRQYERKENMVLQKQQHSSRRQNNKNVNLNNRPGEGRNILFAQDYDEKRRKVIEQHPGNYNMHKQQDQQRYDEMNFEEEFGSDAGNYTN